MNLIAYFLQFRRLPAGFRALLIGSFAITAGRAMSIPFLTIYLHSSVGLPAADVGLIIGLGILVGLVSGVIGGGLSDYFDRKALLLASLALIIASLIGFSIVSHIYAFFLLNVLLNIGVAFFDPVSKAFMSDEVPESMRAVAFSMRYMFINLGWAIGPLLGAALGAGNSSAAFAVSAAPFIAVLVFLSRYLHSGRARSVAEQRLGLRRLLPALAANRELVCLVVGGAFAAMVYGTFSNYLSYYVVDAFEDGEKYFALTITTNSVCVVLLQPWFTRFIDRLGASNGLLVGTLLLALGEVLMYASPSMMLLLGAMIVFTLGEGLILPCEYLAVDQIAPPQYRGMYFGVHNLRNVGMVISPWLCGLLFQTYGAGAMFGTLVACSVIASAFFCAASWLRSKDARASCA